MRGALTDTIVAPATPVGRSALAIVRIDGSLSGTILKALGCAHLPEERHAAFVRLEYQGEALDECVAIRYLGPRSFTGNDLVELTLHGNPLLVQRVVSAAVSCGARMAEPGEFTERAVVNGKIDLLQAESVADLINARTPLQAKLSLVNLGGCLSETAMSLRSQLLYVISRLEAALDFSEDGYSFIAREDAIARVERCQTELRRLSDTFRRGAASVRGLEAVIIGRPNAGKSTLLNRLVGSERSIVTPVAGTTRDIVRETIELGGLPVTLSDTAGLRTSEDMVEAIGIERAREAARRADIVIHLIDATAPEQETIESTACELRVFTKVDLAPAPRGELGISVPAERGIEELIGRLDAIVQQQFAAPEGAAALVNERQRTMVAEAEAALSAVHNSLNEARSEEIVLVDLYRVANALAALTGAISNNDIITEIFTKFCIGK